MPNGAARGTLGPPTIVFSKAPLSLKTATAPAPSGFGPFGGDLLVGNFSFIARATGSPAPTQPCPLVAFPPKRTLAARDHARLARNDF